MVDCNISSNYVRLSRLFLRFPHSLYMSAHVLLNLLNELFKRDKMRGVSSILLLSSQPV